MIGLVLATNSNDVIDSKTIIAFLLALGLTIIIYEIYPFIRVVIMKKKYDEKQAKKMAKWNTIIACAVTFFLSIILFEEARKNPSAAMSIPAGYLYYLINKKIWISKDKNKDKTKEKNKEKKKEKEKEKVVEETIDEEYTAVCSNCGTLVKDSDIVCPNCGESFNDEEEEEIETDMDQKYADLKKLKQLLDDKIITKAEFEKEKKKILK